MQIYERVFDLLQKKGISQKEFSQKTGIPQSTISDWKGKGVNPTSDKILMICEALEVSPYDILSDIPKDGDKWIDFILVNKKSDEYYLIKQYRSMKEEDQSRIKGYIDAIKSLRE